MKAVILASSVRSRTPEELQLKTKPIAEIGEMPIL